MSHLSRREKTWPAWMLAMALMATLLALHLYHGMGLLVPSPYNSYTLQAMAWREGRSWLLSDVPHLELAIYHGRYFVSFPPVPSLPIYLLSFLFGAFVPDGLLIRLYILIAFFALTRLLQRAQWRPWPSAVMAYLICAASSMLPLLLSGAVWYQAQVMAFMWTCLAIDWLDADRPTLGLISYALAVGCRPFNALYGPLLIALYLLRQPKRDSLTQHIRRLLPGIGLGLCVAAAYGWYNALRFGDPFEFGHNHLPEFSFQGGKQFSLQHIAGNAVTFLWGLPFDVGDKGLTLKPFGFSLLLANPILLLLLMWAAADLIKKKSSPGKGLVLLTCLLHVLLLLSHRTFGGFQYGARYAVDLIPYAAIYMTLDARQRAWRWYWLLILCLGLVLAVWGSAQIILPF